MIKYSTGGINLLLNIGRLNGSVFPKALLFSIPSSAITAGFIWGIYEKGMWPYFKDPESVMNNNAIWGGFSFLVGFLVVFRTSQAYNRFWEGCTQMHKMGAEWFDACSSLVAFCQHSVAQPEAILRFQNVLIRLFSLLHAAALGEIEGEDATTHTSRAFQMELVDADSLDRESLSTFIRSDAKVELVFQWLQQLIVCNINTGVLSIPPPILSRSFQEIATGMVHFHEAMKISNVLFPFPYAQTCDALLVLHWLIVPFICSQWVTKPWFAALFCFIQVFTLWTLNLIAVELENPFGSDANDIDGEAMHDAFNNALRLLVKSSTKAVPTLSTGTSQSELMDKIQKGYDATSSFKSIVCCTKGPQLSQRSARAAGSSKRVETRVHGSWSGIISQKIGASTETGLITGGQDGSLKGLPKPNDDTQAVSAPEIRESIVIDAPTQQIVIECGHWEPFHRSSCAETMDPDLAKGLPQDTSARLLEIFEEIDVTNPDEWENDGHQVDVSAPSRPSEPMEAMGDWPNALLLPV